MQKYRCLKVIRRIHSQLGVEGGLLQQCQLGVEGGLLTFRTNGAYSQFPILNSQFSIPNSQFPITH